MLQRVDDFLKKSYSYTIYDFLKQAHGDVLSLVNVGFINIMYKIIYNIHEQYRQK